ncbi:SusD/RagB family nutrient-binding outer membrane lipoprotein [uncultured Pontibacter sp.]|uniref:SusD/RagB family nutrient-binding outer membrane lipoprotein n=1 Tax=uncultured Pontibacter sp. TaxID=453356 RepID=UPI002620F4E3|nr:SusD/RagB family nutrient-binding outer membrane lipoprotein [uncultured Pontibacter sp.]
MKNNRILSFLLAAGLAIGFSSCSDDVLDEIDTNPNSPEDVSLNLLMPQVTVNVPTAVTGTDLGWYASIYVRHTAGAHGQLQEADRRSNQEASSIVNNVWNNIYAGVLPDLNVIIEKGTEEGNFVHVGIAKVLKAYTMSVATDTWGRVPFSEIGLGSELRKPKFDPQQQIYTGIQNLLDEAIADLARGGANPGTTDLIYGGSAEKWTKAAWSLKARYYNRLSKVDPQGSATSALAAAANGFASSADNFTFAKYTATAIGEHPWFQESNDRAHHSVSDAFVSTLTSLSDPRLQAYVKPVPSTGVITGFPNGNQENDQAGEKYSRPSAAILNATATMPLMTFDELKFIQAEANLRLGNADVAYTAYKDGVSAAMKRQIAASDAAITTYLTDEDLPQSAGALSVEDIVLQKWIAFWLYQPFEAYNDWRRTGFPGFINEHQISAPPRRFAYTTSEIAANGENVPTVQIYSNGVWWDDQSED